MRENTRETVLITGASSGIGFELARLFARNGYGLILNARHRETLQEAADKLSLWKVPVTTIVKDLSKTNAAKELFREIEQAGLTVDILVNNAGFGAYGLFHEADENTQLEMLQLNTAAVVQLTHQCLKLMVKRGHGRILNVASTAAFQPGPLMAVYYATKAFVLSFSEALSNELADQGITVTALCPGPTKTAFQKRAGVAQLKLLNDSSMEPSVVAAAGYNGLMKGKRVVIPGFINKLLFAAVTFVPNTLVLPVLRHLQEKRKETRSKQ